MIRRENHLDGPTGFFGDFVGRVLDYLEYLPISVAALCDPPFAVCVFLDQAGIHAIGLQHSCGLFENLLDDGGRP
ncbi:hypothetical protein AB0B67_15405 [Streptomyces spectabilis]|uniref:Uncharacterized protein n=1 Tax=Streptomyces spectabilis TaxID=68270 RepID=A0A7W8AX97_STRST|nr:hypothetical protein [Streptomyces spectabilis]MBB5106344.1 hypothetical protein [Streptomyces spectabilis]